MLYHIFFCMVALAHLTCLGAANSCSTTELEQQLHQAIEVVILPGVVEGFLVQHTQTAYDPVTGLMGVATTLVVHSDEAEAHIIAKHMQGPGDLLMAPWRGKAYAEIRDSRSAERQLDKISPTLLASISLAHHRSLKWPEFVICVEAAANKKFYYSLHTACGTQPKVDLLRITRVGGLERFADHPSPAISERITQGDEVTEGWWRDFLRVRKSIGIKFDYEAVQCAYTKLSAQSK